MPKPPAYLNANDYLEKLLELRAYQPDVRTWSEEGLAHNPPRLLRFRQLLALAEALELPGTPREHLDGNFLHRADPASFAWLYENSGVARPSASGTALVYRTLVDLLTRTRALMRFTSSWLEAPKEFRVVSQETEKITNHVSGSYEMLRHKVARLLAGERLRSFSEELLAAEYAYPTQREVDRADDDMGD